MERGEQGRLLLDRAVLQGFLELLRTWRRVAVMAACVVEELGLGARVYVVGGAAEDRLTALSDLDVVVVLPREPRGRERLETKMKIMRALFDRGLPLDYPLELHVTGPEGFKTYLRHSRRVLRVSCRGGLQALEPGEAEQG